MQILKKDEAGFKATITNVTSDSFNGVLTELIIPAGARVFKGEKCRASHVLVVRNIYIHTDELSEIDEAVSWYKDKHGNRASYIKGEYTYPDEFDTSPKQCSGGIHYCETMEQMIDCLIIIDRLLFHYVARVMRRMGKNVDLVCDSVVTDFNLICQLECKNYGLNYCYLTFCESGEVRCSICKKGRSDTEDGKIKVCGNAYIHYVECDDRGVCMISFGVDGTNMKYLDELMKWFMSHDFNSKSTRRYTYMKDAWHKSIGHYILEKYGFTAVGRGDNSKETGEWQMDLSQTIEYERYQQIT